MAEECVKTSTTIGAKVKELRTERDMTIRQLSEASGLSVGFLSQFERGLSSIAIDSLERIAEILDVPLSLLFSDGSEENREREAEPEDPILHGQQLHAVRISDTIYQALLHQPRTEYAFLPEVYTLLPSEEEMPEMYSHQGEEFIYVLEGTITLCLDDRKYLMYPGDSIHFNSSRRHNWANNTSRIARILTVNAPNPLLPGKALQSNSLQDKSLSDRKEPKQKET